MSLKLVPKLNGEDFYAIQKLSHCHRRLPFDCFTPDKVMPGGGQVFLASPPSHWQIPRAPLSKRMRTDNTQ
jgi:hypothetical protein